MTFSLINERPCRVCSWDRDCPPCELDGTDIFGNLPDGSAPSDQGFESCYYAESSAFITTNEADAVLIRRVIQFPYQLAAGETHSLLLPMWDALGDAILWCGDPFSLDLIDFPGRDRPGWYRDDPNRVPRVCQLTSESATSFASAESSQVDEQFEETDTVIVRWFAIHGGYGIRDTASAESFASSNESFQGEFIGTFSSAATLSCPEQLVGHDLINRLSEVAAEFDARGKLVKLFWGGLKAMPNPFLCNQYPDEPYRNYIKFHRDNPPPDMDVVVVPMLSQNAPQKPKDFDVWLLYFNCVGDLMSICKYLTLTNCEIISDDGPSLPSCECDTIACLKMYFNGLFHPGPPPPNTLTVPCPEGQQFTAGIKPCVTDDTGFCFYTIAATNFPFGQPAGDPPPYPECPSFFISEEGTGTKAVWSRYEGGGVLCA